MTRHIPIGIKTSPQAVDWGTLDAMWARVGSHAVFESVWMNDHLTDIAQDRGGASLEARSFVDLVESPARTVANISCCQSNICTKSRPPGERTRIASRPAAAACQDRPSRTLDCDAGDEHEHHVVARESTGYIDLVDE